MGEKSHWLGKIFAIHIPGKVLVCITELKNSQLNNELHTWAKEEFILVHSLKHVGTKHTEMVSTAFFLIMIVFICNDLTCRLIYNGLKIEIIKMYCSTM